MQTAKHLPVLIAAYVFEVLDFNDQLTSSMVSVNTFERSGPPQIGGDAPRPQRWQRRGIEAVLRLAQAVWAADDDAR